MRHTFAIDVRSENREEDQTDAVHEECEAGVNVAKVDHTTGLIHA